MVIQPEDEASAPSSRELLGVSVVETCRLCMEKSCINMAPIFTSEFAVSIADKITTVTRLNVYEGDELPKTVCHGCLLQLDAANLFIDQCISSDRSLRFTVAQEDATRTIARSEEVKPSLQTATVPDAQLINSNICSTADSRNSVQGAECTQPFIDDFAALRCEMVKFEDTTLLEDIFMENNLREENLFTRGIEIASQMSIENEMERLHSDPLQTSSEIDLSQKNMAGVVGIRDNLDVICAIVALSNDEILSIANRTIKAEPAAPSADESNTQASESENLPNCTMPELEAQTNWVGSMNTEGSALTSMQPTLLQDLPNVVAEIEEGSLESDSTAVAGTIQKPKSVIRDNHKQPDSVAVRFKCPDCTAEYKNKRNLKRHSKLHEKQNEKILETSKSKKQPFETEVARKTQSNLGGHQLDVQSNPKTEKISVRQEKESPPVQQSEILNDQQSPLSVQLSQLKKVLLVKLNRLPANYLSLINPVTPPKRQRVPKKYKCAICLKEYKDKWYLALHIKDHLIRTHPDEKPFKCKKCGNAFKNVQTLNAHIRNHDAKRIYECEHCKKLFMRIIHLKRHMMTHTKIRAYRCQTCGKGFKERYNLRTHLLTHSSEKPFKCEKCFRTFKRECQFKEHLRLHDNPQKPKLWHRCVVCLSDFLTEQRLQDHLQIHREEDRQENKSDKQVMLQISSDVAGALDVEAKSQNSSDTTVKDSHDKINVSNSLHQAGIKAKGDLNQPSMLPQTAGESNNFVCKVCTSVFVNKQALDLHSKTHANEKRYQCVVCGKKLKSSKTLTAHKVLHRPSRPVHTCEICCKTYAQRGGLIRHMLYHAGGEKRFKCSICQRGYILKTALEVHERTHFDIRPFKCDQCDRSYREEYYLKLHMRIHNKEKNYECSQCKTAFHRQSYLQRHMKVHEANRNKYSCDHCDKSYFRRRSITGHLRKFHSANI